MKYPNLFLAFSFLLFSSLLFVACDDDAAEIENEEEVIQKVTLTFTQVDEQGNAVTGVNPITTTISGLEGNDITQEPSPVQLKPNQHYKLSLGVFGPGNEDITLEIEEEAEAHMFFFGWGAGLFSNPSGTGNISSRSGSINYEDFDSNNRPLGLLTRWTTGDATTTNGTLRVVLKHQPNSKTATSDISTGETDIDINVAIALAE